MAVVLASPLAAQENYEIQVYPSETVAPGRLMVELHSNFTFEGEKHEIDGVRPTEHALHETIELTYGLTSWFETGFYIFTSGARAMAGNGSATTFGRACAHPRVGIGR